MADVAQRLAFVVSGPVFRSLVAIAIVAAVAVFVVLRFPLALQGFDASVRTNAAFGGSLGSLSAVADPFSIDKGFLAAAVAVVPPSASFAVLLPSRPDSSVNPLTAEALPPFLLDTLLPAREISTPNRGDYILCYVCGTRPWSPRTRWLWSNSSGMAIGKIIR